MLFRERSEKKAISQIPVFPSSRQLDTEYHFEYGLSVKRYGKERPYAAFLFPGKSTYLNWLRIKSKWHADAKIVYYPCGRLKRRFHAKTQRSQS
jgi:hypothetical protein